ncbi:MAG: hypothetical protein AAFV53_37305 [Myxococcota bacterium]
MWWILITACNMSWNTSRIDVEDTAVNDPDAPVNTHAVWCEGWSHTQHLDSGLIRNWQWQQIDRDGRPLVRELWSERERGSQLLSAAYFTYDVHGNVTQQFTSRLNIDGNGLLFVEENFTYDDAGNLLFHEAVGDDIPTAFIENAYDGDRLTDRWTYIDDDLDEHYQVYYSNDRIVRETWTNGAGDLVSSSAFVYADAPPSMDYTQTRRDRDGDLTSEESVRHDERGNIAELIYERFDHFQRVSHLTTEYDEQDRPVWRWSFSGDDQSGTMSVYEWAYDDAGREVETIAITDDDADGVDDNRSVSAHHYDANGLLTEILTSTDTDLDGIVDRQARYTQEWDCMD